MGIDSIGVRSVACPWTRLCSNAGVRPNFRLAPLAGLLGAAVAAASLGCGGGGMNGPGDGPAGGGGSSQNGDGGLRPDGSDAASSHCVGDQTGCVCGPDIEGTLPTCGVATISPDGGVGGFCCSSPYQCSCQPMECVTNTEYGYCYCGPPDEFMNGSRSSDCSAFQASFPGALCCLEPTGCVCGGSCSFVSQQVPSCTTATLATLICNGTPMVDVCP